VSFATKLACEASRESVLTQGNRFRLTRFLSDDVFEVVGAEVCAFSAGFEAVLVAEGADEVHVLMADDGHVLGSVSSSQSGEIIVEDDVEDPVEAVLDAPER
jgi:hypothetical protein